MKKFWGIIGLIAGVALCVVLSKKKKTTSHRASNREKTLDDLTADYGVAVIDTEDMYGEQIGFEEAKISAAQTM
nr:hypothetical protein [uncultured Niameybacter sp.]